MLLIFNKSRVSEIALDFSGLYKILFYIENIDLIVFPCRLSCYLFQIPILFNTLIKIMKSLQTFLLFLCIATASAETLQIFSASTSLANISTTLTGSLEGGRTIYIQGVGFPFNPTLIQVWVGTYPCIIPADGVTPTVLSCETTSVISPIDVKTLPIKIISDGQVYIVPATTFGYTAADTPYISHVYPSAAVGGTRLSVYAMHRVNYTGDGLRDMGEFLGIYVGGTICSMFDIDQDSNINYTDYTRAQCDQPLIQQAGFYNFTQHVAPGWARKQFRMRKPTLTKLNFEHTVLPSITSVNPNTGYIPGQIFKISGSGFSSNTSKIEVSVDGVTCDVLSSTLNEVSCQLRAKSNSVSGLITTPNPSAQTKGFIGGSGFDYQRYNISLLPNKTITAFKNALTSGVGIDLLETKKIMEIHTPDIYGENYGQVFKGYFFAPVSGNYTFRGSGNDAFSLLINPIYGTSSGALDELIYTITNCTDIDNYYISNFSSTLGTPRLLQGGKYYYMEAYHINLDFDGWFKISVEVPNNDTTVGKQTFEVNYVEIGYSNDPQIIDFTLNNAVSGTFNLSVVRRNVNFQIIYSKEVTLPHNASISQFQSALAQFDSYSPYMTTCVNATAYNAQGAVVLSNSPTKVKMVWTVQVSQMRTTDQIAQTFIFKGNNLVNVTATNSSWGQLIRQNHAPLLGGTFTMDIGGQQLKLYDLLTKTYSIYNIPFDAGANSIQLGIRQIPGYENVEVDKVGDSNYGSKWIFSWNQVFRNVPTITLSESRLTGGLSGSLPVVKLYKSRNYTSNIFFNPVGSQLLFSASPTPQVILKSNNIHAVCSGDCSYSFVSTIPLITSQTKSVNGVTVSVTINDPLGLTYPNSNLNVEVDGQICTITSGTYTSFSCDLPTNTDGSPKIRAGSYDVQVYISEKGFVGVQAGVASINYDLVLSSLSINSGGRNGGYSIYIYGAGFPYQSSQVQINLCNSNVQILTINNTATKVIIPVCSTIGGASLTFSYKNLTRSIVFTFNQPSVGPSISSISPSSASPVQKGVLTIIGSGFTAPISDITVYLTNSTGKVYQMRVLSSNTTTILCGIPGGLAGNYYLDVSIAGEGSVPFNNPSDNLFKYELIMNGITPTTGAYYGGTLITITGINFSPDVLETYVSVGSDANTFCSVQSVNSTHIQCRTPQVNLNWASLAQRVIVTNRLIQDSSCPSNNCQFTYKDQIRSPNLTQISSSIADSGKLTLLLTGNNLNVTVNALVILENKITNQKTLVSPNSINATKANFSIPNVPSGAYNVRIRFDPEGETNSLSLTLRATVVAVTVKGSLKGGNMVFTGTGFPSAWPSKLTTITIVKNSIPMQVNVISTTPSRIQFKIPATEGGNTSVSITIKDPLDQQTNLTYNQFDITTPVLVLLTTSPLSSGPQNIRLNKTVLATKTPTYLRVYNVLNPENLYNVTSWSENGTILSFNYTFKAGKYGIKVWYDVYGWGDSSGFLIINSQAPYTAAASEVSINGGQLIINGADISPDSLIKIGGYSGKMISSNSTASVFEVPPLVVLTTVEQFPNLSTQQVAHPAVIISDGGFSAAAAFDKLQSSYYNSTATTCYIGIDVGEGKVVNVSRIRYFPYYKWAIAAKYIKGAIIEGSLDGVSYTKIAEVDQTVHSGWNSIKVASSTNYRFIRLRHNNTSNCTLSEFEVVGIIFNNLAVPNIDVYAANVQFTDGANIFNFTSSLTYKNVSTPVVQTINPNVVSVYGGDVITFTGVNFDVGVPNVNIDGVSCVVNLSRKNSTFFQCTTGSRLTLPQQNSFTVKFGTQNPILEDEVLYVMRWSDYRTWGTDLPPVQGDLIYVPKGMILYVDQSTPRLDGIVVENGKLIFSDQRDMEIHTNFITVNKGQFRAGTQSNPYQHKLTFIMYGSYSDKQQPMFGNKGIGCMQCKFSMYGQPRIKTWSLLAGTVQPNSTVLTVQDSVDWRVGEQIVIASTSFNHTEAEQRTIVAKAGSVITVDQPFNYRHLGIVEMYGNNRLQLKAEVGLLSRNIKMMGEPTSQAAQYGSHLMMAGRAENGLVAHIAYTQFTHCGQPRIVGRYCIHFHMNGEVPDSYAKGNAVHHSFARVITIHGVHYLSVSQNVGYLVKGHNFFIEDGIQTHNLIEKNLAISSLATQNMLQTDTSVSSFWITNPTNDVRQNRAAGGDFYGFWYQIKPNPDGPSATTDICPIGNPLGLSHDNVAHSNKRFGLRIFKLYSRQIPCDPVRDDLQADPWGNNPSIQSRFFNYLLYKNGQAGLLAQETGNVLFQNFTIADSKQAGMEFYRTNLTKQIVQARNMAIIGLANSSTLGDLSEINQTRGVIGPRAGTWKMSNIRFYNFPNITTVFETCSKCYSIKYYTNTAQQYFVDGITMTNVTGNYLSMRGLKREIIYNTDASFSSYFDSVSRTSGTIVWKFNHLQQQSACKPASNILKWDNALLCDQTITIRKVAFTNLANKISFKNAPMKIQKIANENQPVGNDSTLFSQFFSLQGVQQPLLDTEMTYAMAYVTDRVYNAWWLTGIDFEHLAIDVSKLFTSSDKAIVFKFNYTESREKFQIGHLVNRKISGSLLNPTTLTTLNRQTCSFGDYIHRIDLNALTICATSRGKLRLQEYIDVNSVKCTTNCPSPNNLIEKQNITRLWSNASQWPNSRMPLAGENVTVPANWTIIMDMSPPEINFLLIDGDVIIQENISQINISARVIWIKAGSITAGSSSAPFAGELNIRIIGNQNDPGYEINEYIGTNKLFIVHGRLQLYGISPITTWTVAKTMARKGETTITVDSSISDWQIGDQIIIGPSFSNSSQHELVTITGINTSTNAISFSPALSFTHYGSSGVTVNNSIGILDTRAGVGHVTRNIKILPGADLGWGYHLIVQGHQDGDIFRSGVAVFSGVQFKYGGQYDTENTVIKLQNLTGTENILIQKSSFVYCRSYCIDIYNINNAAIQNNVFYNARVKHVRGAKLNNFIFSNNLLISATYRPSLFGKQLVTCYQTLDPIHMTNVSITSNLCQGSQLHGYAIPFVPCSLVDSTPYSNNTIGSAVIGFILQTINQSCLASANLKAYACQIGHIANPPNTDQITYKNFMIADSLRGVTLRFGCPDGDNKTAYFSNSYISAISRPNCLECYGLNATNCTDGFAVRMLTVTVNGQFMPKKFGITFDVICKSSLFDNKAFLDNIIFENYRQNYTNLPQCSSNVIFKPHDISSDITGGHNLRNVTCNGCTINAMGYFTRPNPSDLGWAGGCGDIQCTGKSNYLIYDQTGDLLGVPSTLLPNNTEVGKAQNCTFYPQMNGHHCLRQDLAAVQYESIAPDYNLRTVWPVYLKYDGGVWNSTTNAAREWAWAGNQPLNRRLGRFVSVLILNQTYNITFENSPPIDMRFQIQQRSKEGNPQHWVVFKLSYPKQNSIRVSNKEVVIKPITLLDNNTENPLNRAVCGSNKYFYANNTVHFVVTADKNCQVRVSLTNSIQINARIDMDINNFFASDGQNLFIDRICAVLGITDTSRMKVVAVYVGSVELTATIDESQSTTVNNATLANDAASASEMAALQQTISQMNTDGSLSTALTSAGLGPLLGLSTSIFYHEDSNSSPTTEQGKAKQQQESKTGLIIGVAVGATLLLVFGLLGFVYYMRKKASVAQVFDQQISEQSKIKNTAFEESTIHFEKSAK